MLPWCSSLWLLPFVFYFCCVVCVSWVSNGYNLFRRRNEASRNEQAALTTLVVSFGFYMLLLQRLFLLSQQPTPPPPPPPVPLPTHFRALAAPPTIRKKTKKNSLGVANFAPTEETQPLMVKPAAATGTTGGFRSGGGYSVGDGGGGSFRGGGAGSSGRYASRLHSEAPSTVRILHIRRIPDPRGAAPSTLYGTFLHVRKISAPLGPHRLRHTVRFANT